MNNTKDALHGAEKLKQDQQAVETEIRGLTSLNEPQKNAEIAKVKTATTRTNVRNILQEASTLNTAMQGLRKASVIKMIRKIVVNISMRIIMNNRLMTMRSTMLNNSLTNLKQL